MSPALTEAGCRQRDDADPSPRWPVFLPIALALLAVLAFLHATGLAWIEQTIERLTRVLAATMA
jgi:hypothetical protein